MTSAPQAENSETVAGVITGVVEKGNGRWQVLVQPDNSQYTRNLWTRDQPLVAELEAMRGQHQTFYCGISHWNAPDGSPRRSLWINGRAGGGQPQPMHPSVQAFQNDRPAPQQPAQSSTGASLVGSDERETRIMRQTATKVASILISHIPADERTLDNVLGLSERLVAYYRNGLGASPSPSDDGGDGPPPYGDDDVPF